MSAAAPVADLPASDALTASQWSAKQAALSRFGVPDRDPRMRACHAALAFHRVRRVIDAERDALDPADAAILSEALSPAVNTMT